MDDGIVPMCAGCGKRPHELQCYIEITESVDALINDRYVRREEGTYNPKNGHFLCDNCYIKAGMPSSDSGWMCP